MNLAELAARARELSTLAETGIKTLRDSGRREADAEHTYRKARAEAWAITADAGMLAKEREDKVNALTADERRARDIESALIRAAHEALRLRRQELSVLQSLAAAHRAEADLAGYSGGTP